MTKYVVRVGVSNLSTDKAELYLAETKARFADFFDPADKVVYLPIKDWVMVDIEVVS